LKLKELKQITVIGLGLLGGSITLAVNHSFPAIKTVGFAHRPSTRKKAKQLSIANYITGDLCQAVRDSDIVILATPIYTFEKIFKQIADYLPKGSIVTDVGSTKILPHKWAEKTLPGTVHYVGSHPIAGSEQRGVEFARDDLFFQAKCILTHTKKTNPAAVNTLNKFWAGLGCSVTVMKPADHDRILANVSHLPHITAVALVNASISSQLRFAGKGFIDTTRIASSPSNIWADILLTNVKNCNNGINKIIIELKKIQKYMKSSDRSRLEKLLASAQSKRNEMIKDKIKRKEPV
jgi:prephenate dehydrogenase